MPHCRWRSLIGYEPWLFVHGDGWSVRQRRVPTVSAPPLLRAGHRTCSGRNKLISKQTNPFSRAQSALQRALEADARGERGSGAEAAALALMRALGTAPVIVPLRTPAQTQALGDVLGLAGAA